MKQGSGKDFEEVYESFGVAQNEIMRLSRMVEGALAASSIQELSHHNTEISVEEILHSSIKAYRAFGEKRALTLTVSDTLPNISVSSDALLQMISNLLANANSSYPRRRNQCLRRVYSKRERTVFV